MKRRMIQLGRYGVCYFFVLCSIGCSRLSDQLGAQKKRHTASTAASSNAASRSGRQRDSNRTAICTWGTFLRALMLGSVLQPAGPTTTYGQSFHYLPNSEDDKALEALEQLFRREQTAGTNLNMVVSHINLNRELIKAQDALQYCKSNTPSTTTCSQPIPCPSPIPCAPPKDCSQEVKKEVTDALTRQSNSTVPKDLYERLQKNHTNCITKVVALEVKETFLNGTIASDKKNIQLKNKEIGELKAEVENLTKTIDGQKNMMSGKCTTTDIEGLNNTLTEARKNQTRLEEEKERYTKNLIAFAKKNAVPGDKICIDLNKEKECENVLKACIDSNVPLGDIFELYEKICNEIFNFYPRVKEIKDKCAADKTSRKKRSDLLYMDSQKAELKALQGQSYRKNPFFSKHNNRNQSHR